MFKNQKVVVVMPAFNAEKTLLPTYRKIIEQEVVDEIILVNNASHDGTVKLARILERIVIHVHPENRGYGANQKTRYHLALDTSALCQ